MEVAPWTGWPGDSPLPLMRDNVKEGLRYEGEVNATLKEAILGLLMAWRGSVSIMSSGSVNGRPSHPFEHPFGLQEAHHSQAGQLLAFRIEEDNGG